MSELPEGWANVTLEDVAIVNPGKIEGLVAATSVSFVPMQAVSDVDGEIVSPTVRPFAEVSKGYTQFQDGDVIFAKITPCMENGKIAVARSLKNGVACGSTEFHVVRPLGENSSEYVWRFLRQKSYRNDAEAVMTGAVGQRRVPAVHLKKSHLPLPPLPEQRRIVAKIDTLTGKSQRARDHLDHIPRLVEKYKQALLASAFRGDLTRAWRSSNPSAQCLEPDVIRGEHQRMWSSPENKTKRGAYREPTVSPAGYSVDSWLELSLEHVAYVVDPHPSHRTPPAVVGGVPYIGMGDVTEHGTIDFANARLVSPDVLQEHRDRYTIRKGDFAFGKIGTLGEPFLLPVDRNFTLSANVILVQPRVSYMLANYLFLFLGTEAVKSEVAQASNATSQAAFGIKRMRDVTFPLPPLAEQSKIVDTIETAFGVIDRLAFEVTSASRLIKQLDQAVLAKAFKGELVPQDPTDEPASVLLERIKTERETAPQVKRMPKAKMA